MRAIHLFIFREFVYYSFYITSLSIFLQAENDGRTDEAKGTDAEAATPECDGGSICDVSSFHEFKYFPV